MSRKSELIDALAEFEHLIGNTPVYKLKDSSLDLFAKLEYFNFSGSLKDRPALFALRNAILRGEVHSGTTIVESSSGNFASALATLCGRIGIRFIPVIDPNITGSYEEFLNLSGPEVVKVTTADSNGGFLKTRIDRVKEICSQTKDAFWTNQYANHDCRLAHQTTGHELAKQLEKLDYIFVGVSSGGSISGISQSIKEVMPGVKVIAVDVYGSVIFGGQSQKRFIPGIGASIRSPLVDCALIDDVVKVTELDSIQGCRDLVRQHGIFAGGSSGSCYMAIKKYFQAMGPSHVRPRVAFICADRGTAYLPTIFNEAWVISKMSMLEGYTKLG